MRSNRPPWAYALAAFVVLFFINGIQTPHFFHLEVKDGRLFGSLVDIFDRSAPVLLLSVGMTLVIATGGVDLSVGAVIAIVGAVAAGLVARPNGFPLNFLEFHGSLFPIVVVALSFGAICGAFNGILVGRLEFQPIVATLLLMVAGRGVAQLLAGGQVITFDNPGFAFLGRGAFLMIPLPAWIAFIGVAIIGLLMRQTALGLFTEAIGSNPIAARLSGVDVRSVKLLVYVISGVCAAAAGMIITGDLQAADANNAGLYSELDAILAVAVGGTALTGGRFSLVGSVIGALLMQTFTTTILSRGISPEVTLVAKAVVVIGVCMIQAVAKKREVKLERLVA